MAVGVAGLGFVLAGCGSGSSGVTSTASLGPSAASSATTSAPVASASAATAAAVNEVATPALKAALRAAYIVLNHLSSSEVAGPLPGTLYYAYLPATGTYWAIAHFRATPHASLRAQVGFQDGGDIGVFTHASGRPWTAKIGGEPFPCQGELPAPVFALWGLGVQASCGVFTSASPSPSA
jgi:hypothetical protein